MHALRRRWARLNGPASEPEGAFRCELHMHSTFSDGSVEPHRMVMQAAEHGLAVIAITDHDTACGARLAARPARHLGLELIPAIEFTARWEACRRPGWTGDVDVLGYFVDLDDPAFQVAEALAMSDITGRVADCCASLSAAGYALTLEELYARNPHYAGMRSMREVLVQKGYAPSEAEAGRLVHEHWQRVRPCGVSLEGQIETIHRAGGVAILAHPGYIRCDGEPLQARHVAELSALGLDGLEVFHRSHDAATRAHHLALAEQFGLLVSGGSDEHGWSLDLPLLGTEPVTRAMVEALRARHREGPKP